MTDVPKYFRYECMYIAPMFACLPSCYAVDTKYNQSHRKGELYMGVSNNRGTPKWMVYNGKPYSNG